MNLINYMCLHVWISNNIQQEDSYIIIIVLFLLTICLDAWVRMLMSKLLMTLIIAAKEISTIDFFSTIFFKVIRMVWQ